MAEASGGGLRDGGKSSAACQNMVSLACGGTADRQAVEHGVRDRRGCAQARKHPAPDVDQRDRLSRWLRGQGDATAQIEACALIAALITINWRRLASSTL